MSLVYPDCSQDILYGQMRLSGFMLSFLVCSTYSSSSFVNIPASLYNCFYLFFEPLHLSFRQLDAGCQEQFVSLLVIPFSHVFLVDVFHSVLEVGLHRQVPGQFSMGSFTRFPPSLIGILSSFLSFGGALTSYVVTSPTVFSFCSFLSGFRLFEYSYCETKKKSSLVLLPSSSLGPVRSGSPRWATQLSCVAHRLHSSSSLREIEFLEERIFGCHGF